MTSLESSYIHILKCILFLLHEPLENRIVIYFSTFEISLPLEHSCASPSNGRGGVAKHTFLISRFALFLRNGQSCNQLFC